MRLNSTPIPFPARVNGRHPERAARVIELAVQQSPIRTPERITDEALAIIDRRMASPRSWWQRLDDRMEASVLVEAVVWGVLFGSCVLAVVVTLLAVRLRDAGVWPW